MAQIVSGAEESPAHDGKSEKSVGLAGGGSRPGGGSLPSEFRVGIVQRATIQKDPNRTVSEKTQSDTGGATPHQQQLRK